MKQDCYRLDRTIRMKSISEFDGQVIAIADCVNVDVYNKLPMAVITLYGETLGLTGWDSDRGEAYYKNSEWALSRVTYGTN